MRVQVSTPFDYQNWMWNFANECTPAKIVDTLTAYVVRSHVRFWTYILGVLPVDTMEIMHTRVAETVMENNQDPWRAAVHQVCDRKARGLYNTCPRWLPKRKFYCSTVKIKSKQKEQLAALRVTVVFFWGCTLPLKHKMESLTVIINYVLFRKNHYYLKTTFKTCV